MSLPNPSSPGSQLAPYLSGRQEEILRKWEQAVRADGKIDQAQSVTREQLRDHVPHLLADLTARLERGGGAEAEARERQDAASHGHHRWEQGYELPELLRETSHLRQTLMAEVWRYCEEEKVPPAAMKDALETLHWCLDRLACVSANQFVEERQAALQAEMQKVRELGEARWRLMRNLSHELRNGINALGLLAMDAAMDPNPGSRDESARILARNLEHLRTLLNRLLDFAGLLSHGRPSFATLDLGGFEQELSSVYEGLAAAKGVWFRCERDPEFATVCTDAGKLRQVANHLLDNALKFTARGSIVLRLRSAGLDGWCLEVEDTGRGIALEAQGSLFEEFQRGPGNNEEAGLGLGLSISRELVRLLGGEIRVDSEPGRGSRFEAKFPWQPAGANEQSELPADGPVS